MKLILALFLSPALLSGCKRVALSAHSPPVRVPPGVLVRVIGITDGDTLTVLMDGKSVKIGLEGTDAPEHGQPHSIDSRTALDVLTAARTVRVAATGKERYGRTLARVYSGEADVGMEMIRQGFAWHFARYNDDQELIDAQVEAQEARVGVWADPPPLVPPWEWRKAKQTEGAVTE